MSKNIIYLYGTLLLVPVLINYGLLTWSAPGVYTDTNPWLGLLGSFLGFIGAISIALMNNNNQKKRDEEQEKKNNRSYIDLNDFQGPLGLKTVKMHENSRLIYTAGYQELLKKVSKDDYKYLSTSYMKISQFGNSEVILNCNIVISSNSDNGLKLPDIKINTGVLEQQVELFIPLVPLGIESGDKVNLKNIIIDYTTLTNERMRYVCNYEISKEHQSILHKDGHEEILFEFEFEGSRWTYPNKLKSND